MITPGIDAQGNPIDPCKIQEHFEELSKYGEIESLNICDNLVDHMEDNMYVQFREKEHDANALKNFTGRFYAGLASAFPIIVDFSLMTGFCEATCRQYDKNTCNHGGYYNFMHLYRISRSYLFIAFIFIKEIIRYLLGRSRRRRSYNRSKSRSSRRFRTSCEEHSYGGHGHSKRYDDRGNYHEGRRKRNKVQVLSIEEDEVEA
ncbi:hypothetical protein J1N35_002032 [Gossypium stocksii]|uniref:Uncharacterized protein n=1 Tax=Gossypium stocksii TaxID=47602 RepID=A0A9D4AN11_9ROSI|nr:hypothetical protein J1N35_002032 [Gossypium stocksii]